MADQTGTPLSKATSSAASDSKMKQPVVDSQEVVDIEAGFLTKTRIWIQKVGAEESGIERVPEDARIKQSPWSLFLVFFSANCCTATLALGYLGPATFGLGWWDSFLCILFFNLLGSLFPAAVARFGNRTGLRTMAVPRYSFGWWPTKVLAVLNIITQIGWGIVNDLSGTSILYDVGDGKLPSAVCVVIIGLIAIIVAALGYKYIHIYERYSWIFMSICFAILAGFGAKEFVNLPMGTGQTELSAVLGFGTVIFGFEIAWVPIAADYNVYMEEHTSDWAVFGCAYGGLFVGQFFVEILGAAIGTLILSPDARFQEAYDRAGMGGLMGAVFAGHGDGVRGLEKALRVPRIIWSLLGGIIFLVCAIAGRDHLEAVMTNFLNMCAYYLTPLTTVILVEHFVWHRGWNYNLEAWNERNQLPFGIAASISAIVGTVIALMCMSQTWWIGPIALAIGGSEAGTDISWMLALGVTTVLYIPLRCWELRKWGR
uniref:Purine-cytosine permease n=1 Tax=Bionectria ochroleuca TaxID=29856 RepID=A0A8H7MZJ4_BIOOC